MRFTSKLVTLAAMVLAAMAFGTTSASAFIPVEAEVEGGDHCNGSNCDVHVAGEWHLRHPITHQRISICSEEYTAEFDEDGLGAIHSQFLTADGGAGCNVQPCPNTDWPFHHAEEVGANEIIAELEICLNTGTLCEPPILIEEVAPHVYVLSVAPNMTGVGNGAWQCPSGLFYEGQWQLEGADIEFDHE